MTEKRRMALQADNIVEMKGMSKRFGHVQALNKVDLELRRGEILGLVGDNAAGKSALMGGLQHEPDKSHRTGTCGYALSFVAARITATSMAAAAGHLQNIRAQGLGRGVSAHRS